MKNEKNDVKLLNTMNSHPISCNGNELLKHLYKEAGLEINTSTVKTDSDIFEDYKNSEMMDTVSANESAF
jgi:hypothetical protein